MIIRLKRNPAEYVLKWKKTETPAPANTGSGATPAAPAAAKTPPETTSNTCGYKIVFTHSKLKILRHTLNQQFSESIDKSLASGKLGRMEMKRSEIKLAYIAANTYSTQIENLFVGM